MNVRDPNRHPRELIILRHAKSDWDAAAVTDFERPLNQRGQYDAPRVGQWIADQGLVPDTVLASPALRAEQTLRAAAKAMGLEEQQICRDRRIYGAGVPQLLQVLAGAPPQAARLMLVGHNPGLEELVVYLAAPDTLPERAFGFLKTATLAQIAMPADWAELPQACGALLRLVSPKQL